MSKDLSRRTLLALVPAAGLAACTTEELNSVLGAVSQMQGGGSGTAGLSAADAAFGIKTALEQGVGTAVSLLGRNNGYFGDPEVRIPLPSRLEEVRTTLGRFGLSGALDDLRLQLNRGAETAAPQARSIFVSAIRGLSIQDALGIVRGGPTSATDYFERTTTSSLTNLFSPIMRNSLQRAGAIQTFDNMVARLNAVPLAPQLGADAKTDLINHGVGKGLDGLFNYIGQEEAAIRSNPAKRTSEILQRVFG
ncbi:MAG: DUF4197 domain-containing protein [Pseudomonadota bacterium]